MRSIGILTQPLRYKLQFDLRGQHHNAVKSQERQVPADITPDIHRICQHRDRCRQQYQRHRFEGPAIVPGRDMLKPLTIEARTIEALEPVSKQKNTD
jgi:hypothetical protein